MKLLAVFAAWAVFATLARLVNRWRADHPSPGEGPTPIEWVKALLGRGPEPEPDPDPEPARKGYRLRPVDETYTAVEWLPSLADLPPAVPVDDPADRRLDRWVAASLDNSTRPKQIIIEGTRLFAVSESTVKRAIRRARTRTP